MKNTIAAVTLAAAITMIGATAKAETTKIDFDQMNFNIADIVNSAKIANTEKLPVPTATEEKSFNDEATRAKASGWTIMVFVNGKNNLEPFALSDMNEMEKIGSSNGMNIVVELGRMASYSQGDGGWKGVRRYLVQKDNDTNKITSPIVEQYADADMGDYKHLIDFAKWAKAKYPAKNYMLIVWNHGAGWIKSIGAGPNRGISYDDGTNNHITTPQLGQALSAMGGVTVYGSDACLMQMASVDYEIKDYTTYIVGSEETEPGDGYTYDLFLGKINAQSDPAVVAKAAVDAYSDHYQQIGEGSTQSYVKSSEMNNLVPVVNNFVDAVMAANEKAAVKSARSKTLGFAYADNKDLVHFANLVAAGSTNQAVKDASKKLADFVTGTLVKANRTNTTQYANAKGMAIYLPSGSYNSSYNELQWAKATKWPAFIKWTLAK